MIGQTISHYRVLEKIGEGGMGLVYLAQDSTLRRKVALKFLPDYLQEDETAHKRFIREARSAAALDHPFICHIHEVGEVEGRDFIAMEYVEGKTLRETLKEGPLSLNDALRIANELIDALEKAHSQRIVHRDLKPSNIMLTPDGHIKVMDFGLAKRVSAAGTPEQDITVQPPTQALTQTGTTLGTVTYMSPEQACGESVDTRSDIFSFGIVLYEMLTGKNPFHEGSPVRTLSAILNKPAPLLSLERKGFPAGLEELVAKMLEKKPERRCQSVAEVRDELGKLDSFSLWDLFRKLIPENSVLKWSLAGVVILLLAGLTLQPGLFEFSWSTERGDVKGDVSKISLAVIPIEDLTGDPGRGHSATDMTIELISGLTKLGKWRRLPLHRSIKRYVGSPHSVPEIGRELDVDLILSGSFSSRDGVHFNVVLQEASSERPEWSKSYSRTELDIEGISLQVVRDLAEQLKINLTTDQKKRLRRGTTNLEAYNLFLRGRSWLTQRDESALKDAIQLFSEAIELYPDYAKAYSARAYSKALIASRHYELPVDYWQGAIDDARKAQEIDDSLAQAHWVRGMAANYYQYDWPEAKRQFNLAKEDDPNDPSTLHYEAYFQTSMGEFEEAHRLGVQAYEMDPDYLPYQTGIGFRRLLAQDYDGAVDWFKQVLNVDPNELYSNFFLFLAYHKKEMYPEALDAYLKSQWIGAQNEQYAWRGELLPEMQRIYDDSGYEAALNYYADQLAAWRDAEADRYEHATTILYTYAAAGNKERALRWLRRSYKEHDASVPYMKVHPMWDLFRDDPIYLDLLTQLNFPEN